MNFGRVTSSFFPLASERAAIALRRRSRTERGFTLIEMLMVAAIFATLVAMATPKLQDAIEQARVAQAIGDISALQTDLATFEAGHDGELPATLAEIGRGGMEDPWGGPYVYLSFKAALGNRFVPGSKKGGVAGIARKDRFLVPLNFYYDLYSKGKDGSSVSSLQAKASQDDVVRADDGSFIGLGSKY